MYLNNTFPHYRPYLTSFCTGILLCLFFLCVPVALLAQMQQLAPQKNVAVTTSALQQAVPCGGSTAGDSIINSYAVVTKISMRGCQPSVTVDYPDCFSVGDKVLIMQMQGAVIVDSNTSTYGTITKLNNAGNYEFARIAHIDGNVLFLQSALLQKYSIEGKVQIVKVPEYQSTRLGYTTGKVWDGTTGGIIAISVADTLYLDGNLNISYKGFRGGTAVDAVDVPLFQVPDYRAEFRPSYYGQKGEGIAGFGVAPYTSGRGAPANGGGGGNNHNAGGGGGANAGCGGLGGWAYNGNNRYSGNREDAQGIGGRGLTIATGRAFMGGGGGSGHGNDNQGSQLGGTSGGNGGGIIIIEAHVIVGNAHTLGARGQSSSQTEADGTGGGGAGGSIILDVDYYTTQLYLITTGGSAGDIYYDGIGPGGGGSGGAIILSGPVLPANVTTSVNGGLNGRTALAVWGNTPGCAGAMLYNTSILFNTEVIPGLTVDALPDTTLCTGDSVQLHALVQGGSGQKAYRWSPTTGLSDPTTVSPWALPMTSTVYTVTVSDEAGCTVSTQITISVEPCNLECAVASHIINDYSEVLDIDYENRTIAVAEPHLFAPGDQLFLIQMQGAVIDNENKETYGTVLDIGNAGRHEFAVVKEVSPMALTLTAPLVYSNYDISGHVQVIRVPEYDHITIDTLLTCAPWNGKTGGVLVLNANCVMMNANIDVTGRGFRGARYANEAGSVSREHSREFVSASSFYWAQKGEGIAGNGIPPFLYGKGSPANGGGGGNNHNAGGGGGANYGHGGIGGYGYQGVWGDIHIPQGYGGKTLAAYYSTPDKRVFMGGGGGSGHINHEHGSHGASGGGIIVIRAHTLRNPYHYAITSRGADAPPDTSYVNPDGCGGGGAGGSVLLTTQNIADTLAVDVAGGAGGSRINAVMSSGPGGGGGGGVIILSGDTSLVRFIKPDTTSGAAGTEPGGLLYGARTGTPGSVQKGYTLRGSVHHQALTECKGCLPVVLQQQQLCGTTIVTLADEGFAIGNIELMESESSNTVMELSAPLPARYMAVTLTLADTTIPGHYVLTVTNTDGRAIKLYDDVIPFPPRPSIEWDGKTLTSSPAYRYQWSLNGYPVYNGKKQQLNPTLPGNYSVTVTDLMGCSATSDIIMISFTSVGEEITSSPVSIYPNPATNMINVAIDAPAIGEYQVKICNTLGATVYSRVLHTDRPGIFVSELPLDRCGSGVYYMYIHSVQGLIVRKFIKN